mmetsp:Transcript_9450/g.24496  ORF Transcript_9450/g.24496 Transcript_9450/m.24496 type:complete len:250 (+) Transcript_9450:75-824(+)
MPMRLLRLVSYTQAQQPAGPEGPAEHRLPGGGRRRRPLHQAVMLTSFARSGGAAGACCRLAGHKMSPLPLAACFDAKASSRLQTSSSATPSADAASTLRPQSSAAASASAPWHAIDKLGRPSSPLGNSADHSTAETPARPPLAPASASPAAESRLWSPSTSGADVNTTQSHAPVRSISSSISRLAEGVGDAMQAGTRVMLAPVASSCCSKAASAGGLASPTNTGSTTRMRAPGRARLRLSRSEASPASV